MRVRSGNLQKARWLWAERGGQRAKIIEWTGMQALTAAPCCMNHPDRYPKRLLQLRRIVVARSREADAPVEGRAPLWPARSLWGRGGPVEHGDPVQLVEWFLAGAALRLEQPETSVANVG